MKMKNSKNIKKYFYEGIPTSTRGKIWALCIGNKFSITKEYYDIEANKSIQLIIKLNKNNIKKKNINHSCNNNININNKSDKPNMNMIESDSFLNIPIEENVLSISKSIKFIDFSLSNVCLIYLE